MTFRVRQGGDGSGEHLVCREVFSAGQLRRFSGGRSDRFRHEEADAGAAEGRLAHLCPALPPSKWRGAMLGYGAPIHSETVLEKP